ncbi:hypothetical protein HGRIS_008283 [Hohenbuehelia grisea]|uniref:Alkaline phytoceramidase n=1 Tax=Hohenbuehelia grisea TaxID=104357 RepID=A0ABR3J7H4_9AGAR
MGVQTTEQWPQGLWGPVTATLDWCEANYQFSYYIAEWANSFSNISTMALASLGAWTSWRHSLPLRYVIGGIGVWLVGLGSFAFHATLLYEAQLADELPMIYVASHSLFLLFDDRPGFDTKNRRSIFLIAALVLFDILFTYSYYLYRNPVYHQAVFASVVLLVTIRVTIIIRSSDNTARIPSDKKAVISRLFSLGVFTFASGFLIWNLDNIFCVTITKWKKAVDWPLAFLLEGHSWWHILTGLGTYLKFVGIQYLTLCIKDDHRKYDVGRKFGLPFVKRLEIKQD